MAEDVIADPTARHREPLDGLLAAILHGAGRLAPDVRIAAAERSGVPERFASYVDAIHEHAYRITDEVVERLKAAGASEDEVFEVTVAAAYGAARRRLEAGLAALRAATETT